MMKARNGFIKSLRYLCLASVITLGLLTIVGTGGGGGGGGNGGGDTTATLTLSDLVGTYTLTAFTVTFDNGTIVTQDDVTSYSGTMLFTSDGYLSQTLEIDGTVGTIEATILSVENNIVRVSSGGCTYNLGIGLSGNVLTTTFPSGTCGANYKEVDVWEKTTSSTALPKDIQADDEIAKTIAGGAVGSIWNLLP